MKNLFLLLLALSFCLSNLCCVGTPDSGQVMMGGGGCAVGGGQIIGNAPAMIGGEFAGNAGLQPSERRLIGYVGTHNVTLADGRTVTMNDQELQAFMAKNGAPESHTKDIDEANPIFVGPDGRRLTAADGAETINPVPIPGQ